MATSVGEGSSDPLEQAEPLEQRTPARSNAINMARRSQPGSEMQLVVDSRQARAP